MTERTQSSRSVAQSTALTAGGAVAEAVPVDGVSDAPLRRSGVAKLLGLSKSSVRRLEAKGVLTPCAIAEGNVRLFSQSEVRVVQQVMTTASRSTTDYDGELASAAFSALDEGVGAADLVKLLKIRPETASSLVRAWCDLRGGVFIPARVLAKIEQSWWASGTPIQSDEDLLRDLQAIDAEPCRACKRRGPQLCVHCAKRTRLGELNRLEQEKKAVHRARIVRGEERALERAVAERVREERATRSATQAGPASPSEEARSREPAAKRSVR